MSPYKRGFAHFRTGARRPTGRRHWAPALVVAALVATLASISCDSERSRRDADESVACDEGFEEREGACEDIDECATAPCDPDEVCVNAPGSFECQGGDPCATDNGGCDANATCMPDDDQVACACNPGFGGDGRACELLVDCVTDTSLCDIDARCIEVAGSLLCQCLDGFEGDGATCDDIDECATDNGGCGEPLHWTCVDEEGPPTCTDIDECATDNGGCGAPELWRCDDVEGGPPECVAIACAEVCDDGDVCNGLETCVDGACQPGTPLECDDDGDPCTNDQTCDPTLGCHWYDDTLSCDDGDGCNGPDVCSQGACLPGPPIDHCGDDEVNCGETCDDGNTSTETECPLDVLSCTACDATCDNALELTGVCAFETCGDACCAEGQVCNGGACCTPDCTARACGLESSCGTSCGTCGADTCGADGQCNACTPSGPTIIDAGPLGGGSFGGFPSVAIDSTGAAHVVYRDYDSGAFQARYATNATGEWVSEPLPTTGRVFCLGVTTDAVDDVHVCYCGDGALRYGAKVDGVWGADEQLFTHSTMCSIATDSAGAVHLASIYDDMVSPVEPEARVLIYANTSTGSWVVDQMQRDLPLYGISLALDAADHVHLSLGGNEGLAYLTNLSGAWVSEPVRGSTFARYRPQIAVDLLGGPQIAYRMQVSSNGDQNIAYAEKSSGTWSNRSLETVTRFGSESSTDIVVDPNGHGHIIYYDYGTEDLAYTTNTSGTWRSQTLASTGRVGQSGAIAVDETGKIHVAYFHQGDGAMNHLTLCP